MPNRTAADKLAQHLVNLKLAACCQVWGPISSTYWWQGKVEKAREWICLAKTDSARLRKLMAEIQKEHPYDTPEIIALAISAGNERYLRWLRSVLASD